MALHLDSAEQCVDKVIETVGKDIRLAVALALGKPPQLINAFYRRAKADPTLSLHIYTALTLEVPRPGSHIEASLSGPIMERLFGDYEEPQYMQALRRGTLPDNIQVTEFYFKAGSMKGNSTAQRNYTSTNYTHVARDLVEIGVNVLAALVATREEQGRTVVSLSSNPDTALDVVAMMRQRDDRPFMCIGQVHPDMPFMENDAMVDEDQFDVLVANPDYNRTLFAVPNGAVPPLDYATALHASSLIPDGGTLQIGIGALGDAVAHACILRHTRNADYRDMLQAVTRIAPQTPGLVDACQPFEQGLYASTEMFVNGMMHLIEHGIIKRRAYDDLALQCGLNDGRITESIDARLYAYCREQGLLPRQLDENSADRCRYWGILPQGLEVTAQTLRLGGQVLANDLDDAATEGALLAAVAGTCLQHGRFLHGGFFLGPRDFYQKLRQLDAAGQDSICMTSVLRTNHLLRDPPLYMAQRRKARFINTGMIVSLTGAVASDALEDGTVISGVGGQYNFVAMAHDLPGARSILCIRSTRGSGKHSRSNIVPHYGYTTIPKHLRDIIVTEYGVADLRGQSDEEIIKRLVNVADSRFQQELVEIARSQGKLAEDYQIPEAARHNTPDNLCRALDSHLKSGTLPAFPFGTDLTEQEIALASTLREIKALTEEPRHFIPTAIRALLHRSDEEQARPWLERIDLEHPETPREFLVQQLLLLELEEKGFLKAS